MSNGVTPFYLPPERGDVPAMTPADAGTQFRLSRPKQVDANVLLKGIPIAPRRDANSVDLINLSVYEPMRHGVNKGGVIVQCKKNLQRCTTQRLSKGN